MIPLPEHLEHKPVFAVPYGAFDGEYAGDTDMQYLSIGLAQYDENSVSAKTMRHTGERWTRQAEELPLHRVIDLTLFLAKALFDEENGQFMIPAKTFQNQATDLPVERDGNRSDEQMAVFREFKRQHGEQLKARLNSLANVLAELQRAGNI